jgi:MFS family permease
MLLLAMRVLQGIAIGGEAPGCWVFVAAAAGRTHRWIAHRWLEPRNTAGSLIAVGLNVKFSQAQIVSGYWRIRIVLGGVFGFIAMFLKRWLNETPVFEEMRQRAALSRETPLRAVLRSHKRALTESVLSTWMQLREMRFELRRRRPSEDQKTGSPRAPRIPRIPRSQICFPDHRFNHLQMASDLL